jgi:exonuclease VII large subunit
MKNIIIAFFLLSSLIATIEARANETITAKVARNYIGQSVKVCGTVSQLKDFSKGVYLNINGAFPNQDITFVLWSSSLNNVSEKFGAIRDLVGKKLCASGKVETYKNRLQISIESSFDLSLS